MQVGLVCVSTFFLIRFWHILMNDEVRLCFLSKRDHVVQYETADAGSKPETEGSNVMAALKPQTELEDFDDAEFDAFAEDVTDDIENSVIEKKIQNSRQIVLDPIFKAQPLTIKERLRLRQEALKQSDPLYINVGKHACACECCWGTHCKCERWHQLM